MKPYGGDGYTPVLAHGDSSVLWRCFHQRVQWMLGLACICNVFHRLALNACRRFSDRVHDFRDKWHSSHSSIKHTKHVRCMPFPFSGAGDALPLSK